MLLASVSYLGRSEKKTSVFTGVWWSIGESPLAPRRRSVRPALTAHWAVIHSRPRFDSPIAWFRHKRKTPFAGCLSFVVEHRGVSSRASTALGQAGSDVPLARHSLPAQVRLPYSFFRHKRKTPFAGCLSFVVEPARRYSNPEDHRAAGLCRPQNCRIKQKSPGGCRGSLSLSCMCWLL